VSEEESGEKTFEPTEKKRSDAAKKGDVLRSKEVGTAAALATGAFVFTLVAPGLQSGLQQVAYSGFVFDREALTRFAPGGRFAEAANALLPSIFMLGIAVTAMTVAAQLLLGEGRFVPENLQPKGSRINPLKGLKRIFGVQGLIELGKSLLKLACLGTLAWFWISSNIEGVMGLGRGHLPGQLDFAIDAVGVLAAMLIVGLIAIAIVDYPLQKFQRDKRLKMSHKDMRDEAKQAEGSPEVKMQRRQRQRDLARGSVAGAMKDAQFVVTNPSHFAVALTYDPELAPAPVVLARGRGETALAMRELAGEEGLPVLEYPVLARAIYFTTNANQMVREDLYVAIASLVAFVLALKRGEKPKRPRVDVPAAVRFDAEGRPQKTA